MRHMLVWIRLVFLAPLFASCVAAPQVVSDVKASSYALVYGLASDYELKISSPDLNRKLADRRPVRPRLEFPSDQELPDPSIISLENLKISLHNEDSSPRAGLLLHFSGDEKRLFDRAELDARMVDETWALGLGLTTRVTANEAPYALGIFSELSGLWAPRREPGVTDENTLSITEDGQLPAQPKEGGAISPDIRLAIGATPLGDQRFSVAGEPVRRYYQGFHDITAGVADDGTRTLLLSLGGILPEVGGEVMTTYRLLLNDEGNDGFAEQALGFSYSKQFAGWLKVLSHTLSYYKYRENESAKTSSPTSHDSLAGVPENGGKWHNKTLISTGDDLGSPFLGLIRGYRMDFNYETETTLLRSVAGVKRRNSVVGTHLKIKTGLGTFFGRMQQSDIIRKLVFGVQKKGWADSQFKLYIEDITPLTSGYVETRIGGQFHIPLERSLFDVFTPDFWKIAEDNLFTPLRRLGYLTPSRGHHVSCLNNSSPGVVP